MAQVLVRCRDGAFYLDPAWSLPSGFVRVREDGLGELVVWIPADATPNTPVAHSGGLEVARAFGYGPDKGPPGIDSTPCSADLSTFDYLGRFERVVPGSEPWEWRPAIVYRFTLEHRPPRPHLHRGSHRYPARVHGTEVFDWDAHVLDVLALEAPE